MSRLDGVPVRPDRGPGGLIGVPLRTDHVPLGKSRSGGFAIAFPLVEIAGYPNHRALTIVLTPASQSTPPPPPLRVESTLTFSIISWYGNCSARRPCRM